MEFTQEQLQQIIESDSFQGALNSLQENILDAVDQKNSGLAASVSKSVNKAIEKKLNDLQVDRGEENGSPDGSDDAKNATSEGKLTLKALQQQIADLNNQLAEKDRRAFEADRDKALSEAVAAAKPNNQRLLYKLLHSEYANKLTQEGDAWFIEDGENVKPLSQAVTDFMSSDDGALFVPPSGVNGAGSTETKSATPPAEKPNYSSRLEQIIAESKSGDAELAI